MAYTHKPVALTVTRTGTKYKIEDAPKEIKEGTVEVLVTDDLGTRIGTYEASGGVSEGHAFYELPDDYLAQLEASQRSTEAEKK